MSLLQAPRRQLLERLPRACAISTECPLQQRLQHQLQSPSTPRRLLSTTVTRSYASRRRSPDNETIQRVKRLQEAKLAKDQSLQGINKAEKEKEYKKRYNSAARKWTASIIALPILLVTSYYLFDRLVRGNKQKEMPKQPAALGGMPEPR
ncbi:Hypothetical protein NCS54_01114400 [Fusarium falciforme]|uniref:Hypothetical protein n=1 Tax=Fusarium falciforme TaxID=195108 RepID=UPI002301D863|nr:Hypothetical protein NCS54_01114400 [Fusarium falciforme]WAO93593.1 Hypothetical protein NCS54_01114400 [Fusarium falciforme]